MKISVELIGIIIETVTNIYSYFTGKERREAMIYVDVRNPQGSV